MKRYFFYLTICFFSIAAFTACKKNTTITPSSGGISPADAGTALDRIKDSIYLFTQEDYLWYDAIPAYATFKPRTFTGTTEIQGLQNEVDALSQYKINPVTTLPYEYDARYKGEAKYSFIDQGQVATSLGGTNGDFGFSPTYNDVSDLRVRYVYPGSPADKAGLVRGYQITKINGSTAISYDGTDGTNYKYVNNALFSSSTVSMTLQRPDNTTFDVTLNTGSYTINPVLKTKIIDAGNGKKIGYLVFNTFTVKTNAQSYLDAAFDAFIAANVTDVVVDLRYNGGGSVETAAYLSNLLVPTAKTGTTMFSYYYNDKLQNDKYPLLAKKYRISAGDFKSTNAANITTFKKEKTLNINRVFFIVTGSTASASELTINNLIPQMTVQLIGKTTYGKPVGFFAIPIGTYQLYVPEFETKNSLAQGGYYAGMTPGSATYPGVEASDDVTHDFGDVNEALLARAISYTTKGTYSVSPEIKTLSTASGKQLSQDAIDRISRDFSKNSVNALIIDKLHH